MEHPILGQRLSSGVRLAVEGAGSPSVSTPGEIAWNTYSVVSINDVLANI